MRSKGALLLLITLLASLLGTATQVTHATPSSEATNICHPQQSTDADKADWCVDSMFLAKWNALGGLGGGLGPGYPVSGVYSFEFEDENGTHYAYGQVFERLSLTYVPDYSPQWQIQVGLAGTYYMQCMQPDIPDNSSVASQVNAQGIYPLFARVWNLSRWGQPISQPFWMEVTRPDGTSVQIVGQYFERGRLEVHNELADIPVLAGRLGAEMMERLPPISALTGCSG